MTYQKSILIPMEKYERLLHTQETPANKPEKQDVREIMDDDSISCQSNDKVLNNDSTCDNQMKLDTILMAIPRHSQHKARALLMHIQSDKYKTLMWNERGEICIRGHCIVGSHISDLVKDALYNYRNLTVIGCSDFYRVLADMNIPIGLIGNEKRRTELINCKTKPRQDEVTVLKKLSASDSSAVKEKPRNRNLTTVKKEPRTKNLSAVKKKPMKWIRL